MAPTTEPHLAQAFATCSLRAPLQWRQFDGEWVVMSTASSSLHQLDPVCAAVLSLLEAGACSLDSLLAAVVEGAGDALPPDGSQSWPVALSRALQHLRQHDLVTDVAP